MKSILLIVTATFAFFSCNSQGFLSISKQVEKRCVEIKSSWKGKSFHDIRVLLYTHGKLDFVSSGFDTLYILENYEVVNGNYHSTIWNRKGSLSYTYNKGNFDFFEENMYTNYTVQLFEKWDTATIRIEEKLNGNMQPRQYIIGARIVQENNKVKIDCIKFKDFFNSQRDR